MTPRRPILLGLLVATLATAGFVLLVRSGQGGGPADASGGGDGLHASVGNPAPAIVGTTLDGQPFDLASLAGKPVVINFWGPSCVPCRDEFPLLAAKQTQHATDGLSVVGVLTDDPVEPAREFVAQNGGDWPTVVDPAKTVKAAYRVAGRPQTYFVDRAGVIRAIQIGGLTDAEFERSYAKIAS
jgi:cytochrome c biogenesis protein CcmG/thiol:disulfide interchange protein DsbE